MAEAGEAGVKRDPTISPRFQQLLLTWRGPTTSRLLPVPPFSCRYLAKPHASDWSCQTSMTSTVSSNERKYKTRSFPPWLRLPATSRSFLNVIMVNITHVDLLRLASSIPYAQQLQSIANASTEQISFISYDPSFVTDILGPNVSQQLVAHTDWVAFHEAGIYNIATGKLYATSNWNGSFDNPINVTAIDIHNGNTIESIRYEHLAEANGGAAFYPVGTPANSSAGQQIVFCDEGDFTNPAGLVLVDPAKNTSRVLLNNFLGRNFTSINDIEQHYHTGDLWFTDVPYGYWQ